MVLGQSRETLAEHNQQASFCMPICSKSTHDQHQKVVIRVTLLGGILTPDWTPGGSE